MHRIRSWARNKAHQTGYNPFAPGAEQAPLPLTERPNAAGVNSASEGTTRQQTDHATNPPARSTSYVQDEKHPRKPATKTTGNNVADQPSSVLPPPAPPPARHSGAGEASSSLEVGVTEDAKPNIARRFFKAFKMIIFSSWVNVLLVFVPLGIAVANVNMSPNIVFAINAVAIIPLASMLSYATESVASRMGDTVGALMNVTFGNAVELIIFIALVKNEIRIVQASLLGSLLANLLLILGMCFLFGGLRYREQIYNSTVTQMSACLLSLSVMSLLLPTAFHASFTNNETADAAVLKLSRGTSVILLLVYVLYLLFQLKTHAYMYESTPQHIIDEESHPGLLADIMGSSSSSDGSSSSSSTSSDDSSGSHTTAKRLKRVMRRGRKRRKSSASSKETPVTTPKNRTGSAGSSINPIESPRSVFIESPRAGSSSHSHRHPHELSAIASGDEADTDGEGQFHRREAAERAVIFRDFEQELHARSPHRQQKTKKKSKKTKQAEGTNGITSEKQAVEPPPPIANSGTFGVLPAHTSAEMDDNVQGLRRPFNIRNISFRPTLPKTFSSAMMSTTRDLGTLRTPGQTSGERPKPVLRRTNSLPDRLNIQPSTTNSVPAPMQPMPYIVPLNVSQLSLDSKDPKNTKSHISRTTAIVLLLCSTGLVALCANYLVDSINYMISHSGVSQAFVGLIILPIVSNAAEHVTAVTVASKNKMDLAIGVAVGSSIQIALFVTPVVVLLGWILHKDMTLYFTLFETISLFVSAFIVNFLVLDGRSNYLEGALLCAAYVIIAVAAFFYPDSTQERPLGGP